MTDNVMLVWHEVSILTEIGDFVFTQYDEHDLRRHETRYTIIGNIIYLSNNLFTIHCKNVGISDAVIDNLDD